MYIVGDSIEVRGTYFLSCRNRSEARVTLFYPFPADSLLGAARMVSLHERVDGRDLGAMEWSESGTSGLGVRWQSPPCAGDTIAIEAVYRQKLMTSYARYIVTTTRAWRQPLRQARFDIHLPHGAILTKSSFQFAPLEDAEGSYYRFETTNFMPDRDITVCWESERRR